MSDPRHVSLPRLRRPGFILRLAVSASVLGLVGGLVDVDAIAARLAEADPRWIAAAGGLLVLQTVLSAARWRVTAGRLGLRIPFGRAVSEYFAGQFVNQTLPGGVLGDVGRAVRSRHAGGLIRAGQAVVLERVAGQVALCAVVIVAVIATALVPGGVDWPRGTAATVVAALLVAGLICAVATARRASSSVPPALAAFARDAWGALAAPEVRREQILLSLGTVACNLGAFAFCALATGTALPVGAVASIVPLVLLAMLIPVGVAGWGFREGAAAALWPLVGASPAAGTAASVAFGATLLAASLPGILPLLLEGARASSRSRRRREPGDG